MEIFCEKVSSRLVSSVKSRKIHQTGRWIYESTRLYDGKIFIQYKSSLEKNAIKYADLNPKVLKWSQEPFCIQYIKPIDNKEHRYFVDMYIEFVNGYKVIVD